MSFSELFMYVPGVIIFLIGSGQVRRWLQLKKKGACVQGRVISTKHVVKKDKQNRETMNYYDVTVETVDSETGHKERQVVKSPTEYIESQEVNVVNLGNVIRLEEKVDESLFNPWVTMIGGALLILLALFQNQGKLVAAMCCLVLILVGAGAVLIRGYAVLKKRKLVTIKCEITDVYKRQISKETKIVKGSKYTYYPIVKYVVDGKENIRRCNINSSNEKEFVVGGTFDLYLDEATGEVLEKHENIINLVVGIVILVIGLVAASGILSQIIPH